MFEKLPELLNKNFVVGFFLPVITFICTTLWLMHKFAQANVMVNFTANNEVEVLIGATILGLISWLSALVLLALNRDLYRFVEGYGRFNPLRIFSRFERSRYFRLQSNISSLNEKYFQLEDDHRAIPGELIAKRGELMRKLVSQFPDSEAWILPTSFGNIIRAFEVYPRVMYGFDAIPGWNRLLGVIPKDYRELVDDAKTQVDFWLNFFLLSLVVFLEYVVLVSYTGIFSVLWFPVISALFSWLAYHRAKSSAVEWGEMVKASFDTFLPELYKKLRLTQNSAKPEMKQFWESYSSAIIYRYPSTLTSNIPEAAPDLE